MCEIEIKRESAKKHRRLPPKKTSSCSHKLVKTRGSKTITCDTHIRTLILNVFDDFQPKTYNDDQSGLVYNCSFAL